MCVLYNQKPLLLSHRILRSLLIIIGSYCHFGGYASYALSLCIYGLAVFGLIRIEFYVYAYAVRVSHRQQIIFVNMKRWPFPSSIHIRRSADDLFFFGRHNNTNEYMLHSQHFMLIFGFIFSAENLL